LWLVELQCDKHQNTPRFLTVLMKPFSQTSYTEGRTHKASDSSTITPDAIVHCICLLFFGTSTKDNLPITPCQINWGKKNTRGSERL